VLQHLRVARVVVGPFAGPSLPLALDDSEEPDDRPPVILCLKSGKLAGLDAFEVALAAMQRGSRSDAAAGVPPAPGDVQ